MKIKEQRTGFGYPCLLMIILLVLLVMTFTACTSAPNVVQEVQGEAPIGASLKKVTFDSCTGLDAVSLEIGKDGTITMPANPSWKPEYTFAGWYTDKSYTTEFANNGLSADTTVFAKWTKNGKIVRTGKLDFYDVTEDISNPAEGWDWKAASSTLTLSGLTIDSAEIDEDGSSVGIVTPLCPNTVVVDNVPNRHEHTPDCPVVTIIVTDGTVNTIDITRAVSEYYTTALYSANELTVKSSGSGTPGILNMYSASTVNINVALYCEGGLTVESGNITAIAGESIDSSSNGIYISKGDTYIKNGTVTAVGGNCNGAYSDKMLIGSFGIHSDGIYIDGGTVTATGNHAASSLSAGIVGQEDVLINGGSIIAKSDAAAVASLTKLTFENVMVNGAKADTLKNKNVDVNQYSLHTLVDDNAAILKEITITP